MNRHFGLVEIKPGVRDALSIKRPDTVGEVWVARSFTALTGLESSFAQNDGGLSWFLDEHSSKAADFANGIRPMLLKKALQPSLGRRVRL